MHTVLLVEDDSNALSVIVAILKQEGFSVITATNGLEGWDRAIEDKPDLIISDIQMPEMNGYELTRKVKNNEETKSIPVILLSALGDQESIVKGFDVEADEYITKPFKAKELLARINRILKWVKKTDTARNILLSGDLSEQNLIEILRFCEENSVTGSIRLFKDGAEGVINLEKGDIQDAQFNDLVDEDAIDELLVWETGQFEVIQEHLKLRTSPVSASKKSKILAIMPIKDDLDLVKESLNASYEVITTEYSEEAGTILYLQDNDSDMLIIDYDTACEEAIRLIVNAKTKAPNIQVLLITQKDIPKLPDEVSSRTTLKFMEKSSVKEHLIDTVSQLIQRKYEIPQDEYQYLELVDIIKLIRLGDITCSLDIKAENGEESAVIYFSEGDIVEVVYGNDSVPNALAKILKWESGQFSIDFSPHNREKKTDNDLLVQASIQEIQKSSEQKSDGINKQELQNIVNKLKDEITFAEMVALVSVGGEVLASMPYEETMTEVLGENVSAIVQNSIDACQTMEKGNLEEILIRGIKGYIIFYPLTPKISLAILTSLEVSLALLSFQCRNAADEVKKYI